MPVNRLGILLFASLMLAAGGCGETPDNNRARTYGHDGYLGLTNSNPNLPGNRHSYWNYGRDAALARQTLSGVDGIRGIRVLFNPPWMEVRVKTDGSLTADEQDAVVEQAQAITESNFSPRYKVRVRASN